MIEGITFTDGRDETDENCPGSCSVINVNGGGDLFNQGGSVTLDDVAFTNNPGAFLGGAVSNESTLTMTDVSFTNDVGDIGGAFFSRSGTVTGNGVTIENDASSCCVDSSVYLLGGSVVLTNTTVVGNGGASSLGGGIHNAGADLALINDTLSGNIRGSLETDVGATTSVANTIIGAGFADGTDGDCVASGKRDPANDSFRSGPAITHDNGHNIDQDGSCPLTDPTSVSKIDPHLASVVDNGGPTRTQALLFGSQAINAANPDLCPSTDQRGFDRDGQCDIGAFEAQVTGQQPFAATQEPTNVEQTQADLVARAGFAGEAGGVHFNWGTQSDQLTNSTDEVGEGRVELTTAQQTLRNLSPGTTYYYEAVADNASGTATGDVVSFTTPPGPPVVSPTWQDNVTATDTSASIDFTIDPQGSDTQYFVEYGTDSSYGQQTESVDIGSTAGPQQLHAHLSDLTPGTTYHYRIVATNDVDTADSGDGQFNTEQELNGTVGEPVTLSESGTTFNCPLLTSITWGDSDSTDFEDAPRDGEPTEEQEANFQLSVDHTYGEAGQYHIHVDTEDGHSYDVAVNIAPGPRSTTRRPRSAGSPSRARRSARPTGTGSPTRLGSTTSGKAA